MKADERMTVTFDSIRRVENRKAYSLVLNLLWYENMTTEQYLKLAIGSQWLHALYLLASKESHNYDKTSTSLGIGSWYALSCRKEQCLLMYLSRAMDTGSPNQKMLTHEMDAITGYLPWSHVEYMECGLFLSCASSPLFEYLTRS